MSRLSDLRKKRKRTAFHSKAQGEKERGTHVLRPWGRKRGWGPCSLYQEEKMEPAEKKGKFATRLPWGEGKGRSGWGGEKGSESVIAGGASGSSGGRKKIVKATALPGSLQERGIRYRD